MINRYAFYGQAAKLHQFYDGSWYENFAKNNDETVKKLVDIAVAKGYHPDIARLDIAGWIKLADPACADYDERYRAVSTTKKSKEWALVESLTLPGLMVKIIEEAKVSKKRYLPYGQMSRWKGAFIRPTDEWYNPLFAKDLYKIKPEWCEYSLTLEEQKEFLAYMSSKGIVPTNRSVGWEVPKDSPWSKFKGTLRPLPYMAYKKVGKKNIVIQMVKESLKKGIKPKEWDNFCKLCPEESKKLQEEFFEVTNKKAWLQENLTPNQQEKLDKWNRVAELVLNDLDDYTLVKGMSTEERALVGNHLKQLDQTFAFQSEKVRNIIEPIIEKIKQQRPVLYTLYCHTKLDTTGNKLEYWMRDFENKEKHKEFIKKAKANVQYKDLGTDERYSLSSFTRKGTKYPAFKKEIEKMRPDWFDQTLRKQLIRKRFLTKKKETA